MRTIVLALLLAAPLGAQDLPDRPSPTVRVKLVDESTNKPVMVTLRVPHKTADKAYWTWTFISHLSTNVDVANTRYCMHATGCEELNPIFGSRHPSAANQYAITNGIAAAIDYVSLRAKRREDAATAFGAPTRWYNHWWLAEAMNTGSHVVGIALTIKNTGR